MFIREYAKNVIYFGCKKSFWDEIWVKGLREVDEEKSRDGERGAIESVRIDTRWQGGIKERRERDRKEGKVRVEVEGWKIRTRFSKGMGKKPQSLIGELTFWKAKAKTDMIANLKRAREESESQKREINEGQSLQELRKIRTHCLLLMIGSQTL